MEKFLLDEEVFHYSEGRCKVVEVLGENFLGLNEYYVETTSGHRFYAISDELSRKVDDDKLPNLCECGAWVTKFPNHHSDYCPLYSKLRGH